jgi:hypothetical protein
MRSCLDFPASKFFAYRAGMRIKEENLNTIENRCRTFVLMLVSAVSVLSASCASQTSTKPTGESSGDPLAAMIEEMQNPEIRMKKERQTPLHIAAEDGKTNDVMRLLKEGAMVDGKDRWNRTPLHLATEWGYVGIVKELLAAGADVNAITRLGETPLFFALRYWQGDETDAAGKAHWAVLVNTLLAAGAKFGLTNSRRLTPLHLAASAKKMAQPLLWNYLSREARMLTRRRNGATPLCISPPIGAR